MAKSGFKKRRNEEMIQLVGQNIRQHRIHQQMTIEEFAYKCGLDSKQIQRAELGESDSSITMVSLYAEKLGLTVCDLYKKYKPG